MLSPETRVKTRAISDQLKEDGFNGVSAWLRDLLDHADEADKVIEAKDKLISQLRTALAGLFNAMDNFGDWREGPHPGESHWVLTGAESNRLDDLIDVAEAALAAAGRMGC